MVTNCWLLSCYFGSQDQNNLTVPISRHFIAFCPETKLNSYLANHENLMDAVSLIINYNFTVTYSFIYLDTDCSQIYQKSRSFCNSLYQLRCHSHLRLNLPYHPVALIKITVTNKSFYYISHCQHLPAHCPAKHYLTVTILVLICSSTKVQSV